MSSSPAFLTAENCSTIHHWLRLKPLHSFLIPLLSTATTQTAPPPNYFLNPCTSLHLPALTSPEISLFPTYIETISLLASPPPQHISTMTEAQGIFEKPSCVIAMC